MTTYMIFLHNAYLGTLRAESADEAIDRAAIRYNAGDDTGIRVTLEGDF